MVKVMFEPLPGCTTRVVPLTETTVPCCSMPVPLRPIGGTALAGGTGLMLKTGLTVTVVPEIATDWPASRSMSSEVDVLLTVIAVGKVMVYELVASVGVTEMGSLVVVVSMYVICGLEKVIVAEV